MEVMFAAVIALKAYSGGRLVSGYDDGNVEKSTSDHGREFEGGELILRTNLVQTTLVGEDSDMSVVACAS